VAVELESRTLLEAAAAATPVRKSEGEEGENEGGDVDAAAPKTPGKVAGDAGYY
jgi:hypothetical protein